MINLRLIQDVNWLIAVLLAYTFSATTAGYFQAWAARKLGDSAPEQEGFLTWSPLVHIDPLGAFCLLFFGIGWGKFMPLHPEHLRSKFRVLLLFLAKPAAYMGIAFFALLSLLRFFGLHALSVVLYMISAESMSLRPLAELYPTHSSFTLALALILFMLVYIGILFAVLNLIIGCLRFLTFTSLERYFNLQEGDFASLLLSFLLILLLARPLKLLVVYTIYTLAYYGAPFIGAM
ncbi:MAG: hypothetical protein AB7R69_00605 [Candidatus Babeliales bacterium]